MGILIDLLSRVMDVAVIGGIIALYVLEIKNTEGLCKINKQIKLFSEQKIKRDFEETLQIFPKLKKRYYLFLPLNVLTFYKGLSDISGNLGSIEANYIDYIKIFSSVSLGILCLGVTAMTVIGFIVLKSWNHAYQLYLNLFPPSPDMEGFEEKKREILQDDKKLFGTLEGDNASENPDFDYFSEGDPELMEYVGGGKARIKEEFEVPNRRTDETADLAVCPLCGSLNPKNAKNCDFCGGELPDKDEADS